MAYIITDAVAGNQPIASTSTVKNHPLGKIVRAKDPTYGEGEFIYLAGVTSTIVGSWVTYNMDDGTTTLLVPNAIGPVAVSMSANVGSQYGWYQIQGKAIGFAADVADNGKVYIDTVAGKCDDAVVAGDKVHNAKWASVEDTATNLAEVEIARPFCTDEST
jgi:hypothetical protein